MQYSQICRFLKLNLEYLVYFSCKNIIELTIQYKKNKIECLDDSILCKKNVQIRILHNLTFSSIFKENIKLTESILF